MGGGGDGEAHVLELGAGAAFLFRAGIFLDDFAEFANAGGFLIEFEEGHAFFQVRGSELEAFGIVADDLVVFGDGLIVLALSVGNFTEIELSVGSEVGVAVKVKIILKFGAGEFIFSAGDITKTVGIEKIRRGRGIGAGCGSSTRSGRRRGSAGSGAWRATGCTSGIAAGEARVDAGDRVLEIDELLVELAEAGFNFLEIVGEALDLGGHGVESGAGIGLDILDGFLETRHGGVELVDGIGRLLDQSFQDSVVLGHLGLHVFLTLQQGGDIALELNDFAGHGHDGLGADEGAGDGAGEHGSGAINDGTNTHDDSSQNLRGQEIRGEKSEQSPNIPI